ncbi:MAG TPA: zinc ribbon domain-containing protein [Pyrinomonadaceae bacterium]|nr:zinc ribbon domain-containing protein [Pyrinomonadaceae bacterium]
MKTRLLTHVFALLVLTAVFAPQAAAHAHQQPTASDPPPASKPQQQTQGARPVDLGAFLKEVLAFRLEQDRTHLAIWIPYEFFVAAASADGTVDRAAMERDLDFLRDYIPFVIQNEYERPDGTKVYATEAEMRTRAVLKLADGSEVAPLTAVPPKLMMMLAAMRAVVQADGGRTTQNMQFLVFPSATRAGRKIVDSSQKDSLTLFIKPAGKFGEASFTWRTPFDALTGQADCPRCRSGVSSKWTYCPFCGQKLPH